MKRAIFQRVWKISLGACSQLLYKFHKPHLSHVCADEQAPVVFYLHQNMFWHFLRMPEYTCTLKLTFFRQKGKTNGLISKAFVHHWVKSILKEGPPQQCIVFGLVCFGVFLVVWAWSVSLNTETVLPPWGFSWRMPLSRSENWLHTLIVVCVLTCICIRDTK